MPTLPTSAEKDDQKFAQGLNEEGMLFNFNLQRKIAQDYCESVIRSYNQGYSRNFSDDVTRVAEKYGWLRVYAFETLQEASAYCFCVDMYLFVKPTFFPAESCSAFEIDYANKYGYQLPVTP